MPGRPSPVRDRTVLVTGGAGFIGSHLVDTLAPTNDVRVLDDFSTGCHDHVHESATVYEGSVTDRDLLASAVEGVDVIVHLAATVSVERTVDDPFETNQTNLTGTLAVLEAARAADARVVFASSAAVYGHPTELPVAEMAAPDPISPYGVQKLAGEEYVRLYDSLYDLPTVTLRYFNVYGPRQRGPYSGVISTFLDRAQVDEPIPIHGDGRQTRDFVHVDDVVRATCLAMATETTGGVYNVATGEATSIRELAELTRAATDSASTIVNHPSRRGDVRHCRGDATAARRDLGFEPRIPIRDGLVSLVTETGRSTAPSLVLGEDD